MVEDLGPKKFARVGREYFERIERSAGTRKAIVAALRAVGYSVSEQAVGAWVRGESEPDLAVTAWLGERFGVSFDEVVLGRRFQDAISDQLQDQAKRIQDLETTQDHLLAWAMSDSKFVEAIRRRDERRREEAAG